MTTFNIEYQGDELDIEVTSYSPFVPMAITGSGYGDYEPPVPEQIEFVATVGGKFVCDEQDADDKLYWLVMERFKEVV